ncbi:hypothetical protein [Sediminibacillus massiliensis]|uniref:hypothetical protein n=1 Tax=Sediminibacillus massiliensis TaxID=1926277 RepID=UPI001C4E2893|nr:hypothetical protein [Sediminibacillus massiliensis]
MPRTMKHEYAIYKGEELLCMGNAKECAEALGVRVKTIYYYATPSQVNRIKTEGIVAVKLNDSERE